MDNYTFNVATLDTQAKAITILTCILLAAVIYLLITTDIHIVFWTTILNIGLILIPFICYGLKPTQYSIENRTLIIHRLYRNVHIDTRQIQSVEKITRADLRGALRKFGNGGIFGYTGRFYKRNIGNMSWYATNLDNAVLLTFPSRKILLTPENVDSLMLFFPQMENKIEPPFGNVLVN